MQLGACIYGTSNLYSRRATLRTIRLKSAQKKREGRKEDHSCRGTFSVSEGTGLGTGGRRVREKEGPERQGTKGGS